MGMDIRVSALRACGREHAPRLLLAAFGVAALWSGSLSWTASPAASAQPALFVGLGDIAKSTIPVDAATDGNTPGSNLGTTNVGGISRDGLTVVGGSGKSGDQAFVWVKGKAIKALGNLPGGGLTSWAEGVTGDGTTVVGTSEAAPGVFQGFRWTEQEGLVGLGFLPGGKSFSTAGAISQDGNVIVGQSESEVGKQAFRWTAQGGMIGLGFLPGDNVSEAFAVSADGSVVCGNSGTDQQMRAFRWTLGEGMVSLGSLTNIHPTADVACATIGNGSVLAGGAVSDASFPGTEAFIWTKEKGMVGLGHLPGGKFPSIVYGLSADGTVAVGSSTTAAGAEEPFIWDATNGMRPLRDVLSGQFSLDMTEWTLNYAVAVSGDGQSIGGFGSKDGLEQGWVVYLNPTE
jgi:probable HAF family extracellular repeat protein